MEETYAELLKQFKNNERHVQFIKDMRESDIAVRTYSARGSYGKECPAVRTSDDHSEQDIRRATLIDLRCDNLGRRYILYP